MPTTPTLGLPYPAYTDAPDGPYFFQQLALAVEAQLGLWQDFPGAEVHPQGTSGMAAGVTLMRARWSKIGKTVFYIGEANTSATVSSAAVTLPSAAGTPAYRSFNMGPMVVTGASAPSDLVRVGFMSAGLNEAIVTATTNGYRDMPSGHALRWNLTYEVN